MERLPEAVDDAELVVLNGDIVDGHRGLLRGLEAELVARLSEMISGWRAEGREVVYVEGNHDTHGDELPVRPDRWVHDWEGAHGERIRTLHGHRFSDEVFREGLYEGLGKHLIWLENKMYAEIRAMRRAYSFGPGWLVGAIGKTEDVLWTRDFPRRVARLLGEADVLLHGHFHFGKGRWAIHGKPVWRTGAWVSRGHLGSVDRMLRYRDGRFERIGLDGERFRAIDDGR